MARELPEELRKLVQQRMQEEPELFEKFGNPLDENDPRFWTPSEREERGVSLEDRVKFLELDVEAQMKVLGEIVMWKMSEEKRRMRERIAEAKNDPQKAMELLREIMGDDNPENMIGEMSPDGTILAGSVQGASPDAEVSTPQGTIKVSDIPGYRNDPDWKPSPDWLDANCMCPVHQAQRAQGMTPPTDDGPTGFYL